MAPVNKTNKRKKTHGSSSSTEGVSTRDIYTAEIQALRTEMETSILSLREEFRKEIEVRDRKIEELEQRVSVLKLNTNALEDKIDENEAYERRDAVVISGTEVPAVVEGENPVQLVCGIIKDKVGVVLKPEDVSVAHRLGKKPINQTTDRRSIIAKFCRRDTKHDILKACRAVKPRNIYVNENLTPIRSTALYGIRNAKRKFPDRIAGYGTIDGRVYAWIKPLNPSVSNTRNTKMFINTRRRFGELCASVLRCGESELVDRWPIQ